MPCQARRGRRRDELLPHLPAWEALAAAALEPNLFYEPWMLLPAVEQLGAGVDLRFVLLFAAGAGPSARPVMCGLFPLERRPHYRGLPAPVLRLWRHAHCFLGTPLLHAAYAPAALAAFFDWLRDDPEGAALVELRALPRDGLFHQALFAYLEERRRPRFLTHWYQRAFFRPAGDADSYLRTGLSGDHRKDLRRKERRLAAAGPVEYVALQPGEDVGPWIDDFLRTEAGGWKGRQGTALACHPADRAFFAAVLRAAHARRRLDLVALRHAGRPVALSCHFRADPGGYYFKTAFDEGYARFSPGKLLEVEKIRRHHARRDVAWVDSCASPHNQHMNHLWHDRRELASVLVSAGARRGDLVGTLLPWLRRLKRRLYGPHYSSAGGRMPNPE